MIKRCLFLPFAVVLCACNQSATVGEQSLTSELAGRWTADCNYEGMVGGETLYSVSYVDFEESGRFLSKSGFFSDADCTETLTITYTALEDGTLELSSPVLTTDGIRATRATWVFDSQDEFDEFDEDRDLIYIDNDTLYFGDGDRVFNSVDPNSPDVAVERDEDGFPVAIDFNHPYRR